MHGEIVALDLETTGLDPRQDAIIEFGAVRMVNGEIVEEFSTLINPLRSIPETVSRLTGIRDSDMAGGTPRSSGSLAGSAPTIARAIPLLQGFVRDAPIVAHNVTFDRAFLAHPSVGLFGSNVWIDTLDLATTLLPTAQRYSLDNLAETLGVELRHHRALEDARATALIYWKLWLKLLGLSAGLVREISQLGSGIDWSAQPVFEAAVSLSSMETDAVDWDPLSCAAFAPPIPLPGPARYRSDQTGAVQLEMIRDFFEPDGRLAKSVADFEPRPQQMEMALAVSDVFIGSRQIMIEAGTGTGKSFAYLIPAALWAHATGAKVVISTNTLTLQDQLLTHDLPVLQPAFDFPVTAAVAKGRSHYLCPARLQDWRRRGPSTADELRVLARTLIWLDNGGDGDRQSLSLRGPIEMGAWQRLSAEAERCTTQDCAEKMAGRCPFAKARQAADRADLLIVNHALLVADAQSDYHVLPAYEYLIVDEGHHIVDAITSGLTVRYDAHSLRRMISDLGNMRRGLLGDLLSQLGGKISASQITRIKSLVKLIVDALSAMDVHTRVTFEALATVHEGTGGNSTASDQFQPVRLVPAIRAGEPFQEVLRSWSILSEFLETVSSALQNRLLSEIGGPGIELSPEIDALVGSLTAVADHLGSVKADLDLIMRGTDSERVCWISSRNGTNAAIHAAPLKVDDFLREQVWRQKKAVVITSATLQANGEFEYMQSGMGANHMESMAVGSPFDFKSNALLFVPTDIPEPTPDRPGYQRAVERAIVKLASAMEGRLLVLFTSYSQLQQTALAIENQLGQLGDIAVLTQNEGSNRPGLLESFRTTPRSVLLGTRSFWEGIDVPGDPLSGLIIARLPFAVPTDPIIAARSELLPNPFDEYSVPDAIIRFRQGFGRLIRRQTDRGIVVVLDRRIITKAYGRRFLAALPDCTVEQGPVETLPAVARRWLDHGQTRG